MMPFDVARCNGVGLTICEACRRREPGDPERQVMTTFAMDWDGSCLSYIPQDAKELDK